MKCCGFVFAVSALLCIFMVFMPPASAVKTVYYWNFHSEPEGLNGSKCSISSCDSCRSEKICGYLARFYGKLERIEERVGKLRNICKKWEKYDELNPLLGELNETMNSFESEVSALKEILRGLNPDELSLAHLRLIREHAEKMRESAMELKNVFSKLIKRYKGKGEWKTKEQSSIIKVAVNYNFIYHLPPNRTYEEAAKIIKELNADFLRAYTDNSGPMPETVKTALEEFKKCNVPDSYKAAQLYTAAGRTWEQFNSIISAVKKENPDIIFEVFLHPQYVTKITWDPLTHECIDTSDWALNFGKWGLINPETGKVFTLEESQKFMNEFTGGVPEELNYYWYPDLTKKEFQEYLLRKTERYVDSGADAIAFDILFGQLNAAILLVKWMKKNGYYDGEIYEHPAITDTVEAINKIVEGVKQVGNKKGKKIYVGCWGVFLSYPEEIKIPKFDYLWITPTREEVESLSFDRERWENFVKAAKERMDRNVILMSFMDNGGLDKYPMHVFSQELTHEQQIEFLKKWDNLTRSLGIVPIYPVQDGAMGQTVRRLSYGKYNKFDALAPEFDLYSTIQELALKAKENNLNNKTFTLSSVRVAILYTNLGDHIPENRTVKDAIKIITDLKTDFVWRIFDLAIQLPPESKETAYRQFRRVGYSKEEAERLAKMVAKRSWTFEDFKEQISLLKSENPNIIVSAGVLAQVLPKNKAWDPITLEPISPQELRSMALDLSKWGLPYDLNKTQEIFTEHSGFDVYYPDISNPKYREYLIKKAKKAIDVGADAIWFDMLFAQASILVRYIPETKGNFYHPAVKDSFDGACEVIRKVKEYGLKRYNKYIYVGTWAGFLMFPYECKEIDFITENPSSKDIYEMKINEVFWDEIIKKAKEKVGEDVIIFGVPDWGPWDTAPLAVFSQKLTPEQQREFLRMYDEFFEKKGIIHVFPVHGGDMGPNAKILSYGKYKKYDALAPEFNTYETIKELALKKIRQCQDKCSNQGERRYVCDSASKTITVKTCGNYDRDSCLEWKEENIDVTDEICDVIKSYDSENDNDDMVDVNEVTEAVYDYFTDDTLSEEQKKLLVDAVNVMTGMWHCNARISDFCGGQSAPITVKGKKVLVGFDEYGRVVELVDLHAGINLIDTKKVPLFTTTVLYNGKEIELTNLDAKNVKYNIDEKTQKNVVLVFENLGGYNITAICNISIDDNNFIKWKIYFKNNNPDITIRSCTYPIFPVKGDLGKGTEYLLAPHVQRSALYTNPVGFVDELGPFRSPGSLLMQFIAYYNNQTGLYMATYDNQGWVKDLIIRNENNSLLFLWIHYFPEEKGKDRTVPYEVVTTVFHGDWYTAADIYKQWAYKQPWCAKTLKERIEEGKVPEWITYNSLWMAIEADYVNGTYHRTTDRNESFAFFGENFWRFMNPWLKILPTPPVLLYRMASKYWNAPTIDFAPSFPSDEAYINTLLPAKKKGIRAFTFIHDYRLALTFRHLNETFNKIEEVKREAYPYLVKGKDGKTVIEYIPWLDGYATQLCKYTDYAQDLKVNVGEHYAKIGFSMVQMDQSGGVNHPLCYAEDHGHLPGGGKWYTEKFMETLRRLKEVCRKYESEFAVSEEGPNELFIQELDTYMARDYVIPWDKNVEIVPAFKYVYNQYINGYTAWACWDGIVVGRTPEEKEQQYNVCIVHLARSLLAGHIAGIVPIPVETLDHNKYIYYLILDPKEKDKNPVFKTLIQHAVLTSTDPSREYLLFGRMLRPPELDVDYFELVATSKKGSVSKELPKILHNAFEAEDGSRAVFLVNVVQQPVKAKLHISELRKERKCVLLEYTFDGREYVGKEIPYRDVVSIEMQPLEIRYYVLKC